MKIYHFLNVMLAVSLSATLARAQGTPPQTPQEREKQLMEYVDKEVQRLSSLLELEYWQ